jgi:hypothetical protein
MIRAIKGRHATLRIPGNTPRHDRDYLRVPRVLCVCLQQRPDLVAAQRPADTGRPDFRPNMDVDMIVVADCADPCLLVDAHFFDPYWNLTPRA